MREAMKVEESGKMAMLIERLRQQKQASEAEDKMLGAEEARCWAMDEEISYDELKNTVEMGEQFLYNTRGHVDWDSVSLPESMAYTLDDIRDAAMKNGATFHYGEFAKGFYEEVLRVWSEIKDKL